MTFKNTIKTILNFLTFQSTKLAMQESLIKYYEEYDNFVKDQVAMENAFDLLEKGGPIEKIIQAIGDAKTYQKKAIDHIHKCLKLAPTPEEKQRLVLELNSIRTRRAA